MNSIRNRVLLSYSVIIASTTILLIVAIVINYFLIQNYESINSNIVKVQELNDTASGLTEDAYSYGFKTNDYSKYNQRVAQIYSIEKVLDERFLNNKKSLTAYRGAKNSIAAVIEDITETKNQLEKGNIGSISSFYEKNFTKLEYAKQSITDLIVAETENLATVTRQMQTPRTILIFAIFAIVIFGTFFSVIFAFFISDRISRPLVVLSSLAEKIPTGNLEFNVDKQMLERNDEVGSLFRSFKNMVEQLKEKIVTERLAKEEVERSLKNANSLQQLVKDERDRARGIVASMGEGLFVLDRNLKLVLINPAAERLLEINGQDAVGKDVKEVVVGVIRGGKDLSAPERPSTRTLAGASINIGIDDDYSFKLISGRQFPVAIATTPLRGDGGITGVVEVFRDITSEKQSRSAIEQQVIERTKELQDKNMALTAAKEEISRGWLQIQMEKARLLASVNSITIGFLMLDINGKTLIKNPAVQKAIGVQSDYSSIEVIDQVLGSKIGIKAKFTKCIEERAPTNENNINFNNKFFRLFMAPIFSTDNTLTVIGVVVLIQDETEQKVMDRSKDEFFSIASHELRTPLTAIRGNTSLIEQYYGEKLNAEPELKSMIEDIHASSTRLIQIVNDFLNVSRLEQGKMEFKIENFDLSQLIDKKIEEINSLSVEKHIPIVFERPTTPIPSAYADKDRAGEVLLNLLGNALKYSEKGSITVQVFLLQGYLKVSVTDTGKGISPEQQSLLFHKFQQAGKSLLTRDTTRATGLGLYISKMITEQMGGQVFLEKSEPNVGSTFAFTVPVQQIGSPMPTAPVL
jgi:PAS domain S-box-containing protein